jgi:Domain of unknown function (DUF927)
MSGSPDFLKHILPSEGYYAAFILETKRHYFTRSLDEVAAQILRADGAGKTVYHACASFKQPTKRAKDNAFGAKSFWLDIDAGEGKGYVDATAAFHATQRFCETTRLPEPVFVASGAGLHCYWPLQATLAPPEWKRYAEGLKALCHREGLVSDPSRTADISSILRPPGTHNRKSGTPVLVQVGRLAGPYLIDQLEILLDAAPKQKRYVNGHSLVGRLAGIFEQSVSDGNKIAERCAALARLRDAQGRIAEPSWYAALGVLAYCAHGDDLGHQWSSGHDNYTFEETQARLDRARSLSGATTCERFHGLDPKTCEACPRWQKIKSPIVLGYERDEPPIQETQVNGIPLPILPDGYGWSNGALVFRSANKNGDVDVLISTHPIYLAGVHTGEVRGDFNYMFRQFIPQRGWGDVAVPASMLFSSGGAGELAKQGANIHDHQHFTRYVKHAVDMQYTSGTLNTRFEQFGWKNEDTEFLYGLTLYGKHGKRDVAGSDELQIRTSKRNEWIGPYSRGNLHSWTRAANSLFAAGCEAQSLTLLASFAAPLMRFQAGDEGGAIISLVTRKSGTGKTTALAGAASVWGKRDGLGLTNSDSKISKFLTLGALGNLPIVYDEIETKDPKIIRDFVENFTNGRDKMRATRTGSIAHTASTWQTVLISASNASLIDAMSTGNDIPALGRRILELPLIIPEALKHAIGDRLQQELTNNRGWAGDAYLTWLIQPANLAWTKAALEQWTAQVWQETKLGPDYRFWVRLTGAVAVAGTIVNQLGLMEFSPNRIIEWLIGILKEKSTVAVKAANDDWPLHALGDFLNAHSQNTLVMPGPHVFGTKNVMPHLKHTRELMIRYEIQGKKWLIAVSPLRDWLVRKEISFNEMARLLEELGVCTNKARYATLAAGTDFPSSRVLCIEINAAHEKLQGIKIPG